MGTVIKASCKCGFETNDMCLGGGMSNHKTVSIFRTIVKIVNHFFKRICLMKI